MGIHEYPCPTCKSKQRVKAQAGELVQVKDCEACAQAKGALTDGDEAALTQELDAYAARTKHQKHR